MTKEGICDMCNGVGRRSNDMICPYCNGTGEWNSVAQAYVKNHICQCVFADRKFCPVCKKKCHHTTSLSPKQVIDPGFDGASTTGRAGDPLPYETPMA